MTHNSKDCRGGMTLAWRIGLSGAVASLILVCATARAGQTVSLAWNASPSVGVIGYNVYRGTNSDVYTSVYDVGTNLMITLTGLKEGGTNYFKAVGYNSARMEGTPSSELSYIVPGLVQYSMPTQPGNPVGLSFPVAPGHWYEVQASADLTSWSTIYQTTSSTSNAWVSFQDPQSSTFMQRFYRLVMH